MDSIEEEQEATVKQPQEVSKIPKFVDTDPDDENPQETS